MGNKLIGKLIAFKGDDEQADATVVLEIIDTTDDGEIEFVFADRGERVYLKFVLADLVSAAMRKESI